MGKVNVLSKARAVNVLSGLPAPLDDFEAVWKATSYRPGEATLPDLTGNGHDLDIQLNSTNEPKFLSYAGVQYAYCPGVSVNIFRLSGISFAEGKSTGTIDLRARIRATDYTPAADDFILGGSGAAALGMRRKTDGTVTYRSTGTSNITANSTAALPATDDETDLWVRMLHDLDADTVTIFTSTDDTNDHTAVSWTQLGDVVAVADTTADGLVRLEAGDISGAGGFPYDGRLYAAAWLEDGAIFAAPVFADPDEWSEPFTSGSDAQGNSWTAIREDSGRKLAFVPVPVSLHGDDDHSATTDAAGLDFGDDAALSLTATFRVYGTPGANQVLAGKKADLSTGGAGYALYLDTSRQVVGIVADGSGSVTVTSDPVSVGVQHSATLVRDGSDIWLVVDGVATAKVADTTGDLSSASEFRVGSTAGGTNYLDAEWFASGLNREALSDADAASAQTQLEAA